MLAKIPVGFHFQVLFANFPMCPILLSLPFAYLLCVKLLVAGIFDSWLHSLEISPFELCDLFSLGFLEALAFYWVAYSFGPLSYV